MLIVLWLVQIKMHYLINSVLIHLKGGTLKVQRLKAIAYVQLKYSGVSIAF